MKYAQDTEQAAKIMLESLREDSIEEMQETLNRYDGAIHRGLASRKFSVGTGSNSEL